MPSQVLDRGHEGRTHGTPLAGRLSPRRLSCSVQPERSSREKRPDARQRSLLRLVSEHSAVPVDIAARFERCSIRQMSSRVKKCVGHGWLRCTEYPGEPYPWLLLRGGGLSNATTGFGPKERPLMGSLDHRREVLEVRLALREEFSDWRWVPERSYHVAGKAGQVLPDAVLRKGKTRWAIEVELSNKGDQELRQKLVDRSARYDRILYFCSQRTWRQLDEVMRSGEFPKLEVRVLPEKQYWKWTTARNMGPYFPTMDELRILELTSEEGAMLVDHLPPLLDWSPARVSRAVARLTKAVCLRRGFRLHGDPGWIWCNYRGSDLAGTGLLPAKIVGWGNLRKRFVLMEVRLDILTQAGEAQWETRRRLVRESSSRAGIPNAAVTIGGKRYAVMVLESRPAKKRLRELFDQWQIEFDGVICYRAAKLTRWMKKFGEDYPLEGVEVRDMPAPRASAQYQCIEDEWHTQQDVYEPTDEEHRLLEFLAAEGMIAMAQVPRLLGCKMAEAKRLVSSLEANKAIQFGFQKHLQGGWMWCNARGVRVSETELARAKAREGALDHRLNLMEIRLALIKRFPSAVWTTRRELASGLTAHAGVPHAAVELDGQRYAIGIFAKEHQRDKTVELLSRWQREFGAVKCFCIEQDVQSFKDFLEKRGLPKIEVAVLPKAPGGRVRARQEAVEAALFAERRQHALENRERLRAYRATKVALADGTLSKPSHCVCGVAAGGAGGLRAHYRDFRRPLDIEWLCRDCQNRCRKKRRQATVQRKRRLSRH